MPITDDPDAIDKGVIDLEHRYTGREYDPDTAFYNYRARDYDPVLSKFLNDDHTGFGGGDTNLSRLVGNSFPNATDPSGEFVVTTTLVALYFGGGLLVGAAHGYAESIAADPNAGLLETSASVGLGGLFGVINPAGEFYSAGGAIAGMPGFARRVRARCRPYNRGP